MACEGMATQYPNFYFSAFGETYPPPADQIGFLMENFLYMKAMANENHATDKFWLMVQASLNQLKGLAEGYLETPCNAAATAAGVGSAPASQPDWAPASASPTAPGMSLLKILRVQAWGDLYTIQTKFLPPGILSRPYSPRGAAYNQRMFYPGTELPVDLRCSALFKVSLLTVRRVCGFPLLSFSSNARAKYFTLRTVAWSFVIGAVHAPPDLIPCPSHPSSSLPLPFLQISSLLPGAAQRLRRGRRAHVLVLLRGHVPPHLQASPPPRGDRARK